MGWLRISAQEGVLHFGGDGHADVGADGVGSKEVFGVNLFLHVRADEDQVSIGADGDATFLGAEAKTFGGSAGGKAGDGLGIEPQMKKKRNQMLAAGDASPDFKEIGVLFH